jgi:hypothetical protein
VVSGILVEEALWKDHFYSNFFFFLRFFFSWLKFPLGFNFLSDCSFLLEPCVVNLNHFSEIFITQSIAGKQTIVFPLDWFLYEALENV